ncbi:hypothetical protein GCM10009846_29870 [Agrococcus versicolor]|uniref:Integral membrane protein n=1 Tax=Agrococcus versicolor TaxID=501482 RepID=A0ABP5MTJ9_9MICO
MSLSRGLAIGALAVYATTATMGVGLATGAWRNERHRWVHHVGFIAATTLTAATVVAGLRDAPGRALAAAPALLPLAALPRIRTRSRWHPTVALTAAPWLVAAVARPDRKE